MATDLVAINILVNSMLNESGNGANIGRLSGSGKAAADAVSVSKTNSNTEKHENSNVSSDSKIFEEKAFIALDENKEVVIRFVDNNGKIVRQYPPEEYLQEMKELNRVIKSLYDKKV
jgi:uncharacterized FlaG/YvyC family protein